MDYSEIYKFLEPLCKKAGAIALSHQREGIKVNRKNDKEEILAVVTAADLEIDTLLKETLTKKYPDFGWLSEETEDNANRLTKKHVWVVDPIDGTKSYIDGTGYYAVSIGLVCDGTPVLGMIYNPAKGEMFAGYKGSGVLLNGKKVWVNYKQKIQDATCLISFNEYTKGLWDKYSSTLKLKEVHSIAYKLATLSIGKGDCMATLKPKSEWDTAAGHLLCLEAGLKITNLAGDEVTYNNKNVEVQGLVIAPKDWQKELQELLS